MSIVDEAVTQHTRDFDHLHDSLIALRQGDPRIFTMGDACASKLLHQMVPALFVMWDSKIRGVRPCELARNEVEQLDLGVGRARHLGGDALRVSLDRDRQAVSA
jgi:hypothetical protein